MFLEYPNCIVYAFELKWKILLLIDIDFNIKICKIFIYLNINKTKVLKYLRIL